MGSAERRIWDWLRGRVGAFLEVAVERYALQDTGRV
jgi:hypothetical protein